jgi:hypothetical protein
MRAASGCADAGGVNSEASRFGLGRYAFGIRIQRFGSFEKQLKMERSEDWKPLKYQNIDAERLSAARSA